MKKKNSIKLALFFVFFALSAFPVNAATEVEETIRIGMISPLTGGSADYGKFEEAGARLAVEEINAKGGVLGKKLELIMADDGTTPEGGVNGIRHLLDLEKVVMITGCSNSSTAIAEKEVTRDRVFHFVTAAQSAAITDDGHKWLVNGNVTVTDYSGGLDRDFLERFKPKRVALFAENTDLGQDNYDLLKEIMKDYPDSELVIVAWHTLRDADFTASLTQIKAANPDLIYTVNAAPSQMPQIYKQMNELGMGDIVKVHSAGHVTTVAIETAAGAMEGVYTADLWHPDMDNEMSKIFRNAYEKRYGYTPEKVAALAYMDIIISAQAMEEAGGETNYDKIVEIIKSREWPSMLSAAMAFDETGRNHTKPILLRVEDNKLKIAN